MNAVLVAAKNLPLVAAFGVLDNGVSGLVASMLRVWLHLFIVPNP